MSFFEKTFSLIIVMFFMGSMILSAQPEKILVQDCDLSGMPSKDGIYTLVQDPGPPYQCVWNRDEGGASIAMFPSSPSQWYIGYAENGIFSPGSFGLLGYNSGTECDPAQFSCISPVVTDPAGKHYPLIMLNGKTWMAENLAYDPGSGSWCYDDDPSNCTQYGRLYSWEAANQACAALGNGWRLPTDAEITGLIDSYGGEAGAYTNLVEGGSSGFNALIGGWRDPSGSSLSLGVYGYYWSGTEMAAQNAWYYFFDSGIGKLNRPNYNKPSGLSCRCIHD